MAQSGPADQMINSQAGTKYWQEADASDNGMLGGVLGVAGFASVSRIDLQGSRTFLARLGIGAKRGRNLVATALDAGAGIGRITEGLLLHVAEQVDIIEPVSKFTDPLKDKAGVRHIFNVGLQAWHPPEGVTYDLIWTQWCLGHVTDDQMVEYLELCKSVLTPNSGVIVVKENQSTTGADMFDATDSSLVREDGTFLQLFERAGLKLIKSDMQRGFPETPTKRLFPVKMYALKPAS
ncbi:unnamed protein product [Clonostachys rosea f. rosea IK726]|uniref:Alpha N-terminal protein methyltransferase 1 n=2 Tax=Bionectria ochroleuca TaxID=29856 RepID=A0A0B7KEW2_BIOOC|nr:unnamed protein product [Clonostachys rosea f. rosea IK726]